MKDAVMAFIGQINLPLGPIVAGFFGGLVSLAFVPNITPIKFVVTVMAGAVIAAYITPLVTLYLDLGPEAENAAAFVVGVLGMNVIAGVFNLSERFRKNPLDTIDDIRGKKDA